MRERKVSKPLNIEEEIRKLEKRDRRNRSRSPSVEGGDGTARAIKRADKKRFGNRRVATTKYSRSRSGSHSKRSSSSDSYEAP